jgi:hypothetical protein
MAGDDQKLILSPSPSLPVLAVFYGSVQTQR